jgi:tripartite-type tricarboxylate transporter receptor subunit TctC
MKSTKAATPSAALLIYVLASGMAASAPSVESFYAANRLTIVNGYTPGSVYDLYARLLAKHISGHIPGKPAVLVQNMPGAGSMKAANFIYGLAPRDGSQIATFARGIAMQPLIDEQGVQFDAAKMNWLGSMSTEVSVVFSWYTKPFKTVDDIRNREMIVPATGTGADSAIFPYVLNGVLYTKFKVVTGYPGASETLLAIERGEADGSAATSWGNFSSAKLDWIRDRKVNIILQLATRKHRDLPDVPLVLDFARSSADRQILDLIFSRQLMAYPYVAPPDIPPDRLQALREAFDATLKDPDFLTDARAQMLDIDPVNANELTAVLRSVYASPPDVIARARAMIMEGTRKTVSK